MDLGGVEYENEILQLRLRRDLQCGGRCTKTNTSPSVLYVEGSISFPSACREKVDRIDF